MALPSLYPLFCWKVDIVEGHLKFGHSHLHIHCVYILEVSCFSVRCKRHNNKYMDKQADCTTCIVCSLVSTKIYLSRVNTPLKFHYVFLFQNFISCWNFAPVTRNILSMSCSTTTTALSWGIVLSPLLQ